MTSAIIELTEIANGGAALGRDEQNRVIFVPLAIPGERVRIEFTQEKKRFARGRLLEILDPSPHRIEPLCPHFGPCGGCHFQHIDYPSQLRLKRDIVVDQLTRIGGFSDPNVQPVIPNPDQWAYSNFVTFITDKEGVLGFWSPELNKVLPISTCTILDPAILDRLKNIDLKSPAPQQLTLRTGIDDSLMVVLTDDGSEPPTLETEIPISVALSLPDGTAASLVGDNFLTISAKDRDFRVSANSFFYPSSKALASLIETVLNFAACSGNERVLELYSGVGTFAAFLAPLSRELIGIESYQAAVMDAAENLDEFDHVVIYQGTVEEIIPSLDISPDVMVLDPPGSGITTIVHDEIARLLPSRLIYIGSDMATFARDSQRLAQKGFELIEVQPIDMYPQNYRVLAVSYWQLAR